jgi:hypothetical protein
MTPALTALVLQLVELGIQVAPSVIAAARTEIALVSGGAAPTAEQQASIDAAFEAANAAVMAAQQGGAAPPLA